MGTIWVREFTGGLDARRVAETSPGGTLIRAVDGHINRGGEFEQRADFVEHWTAPPNTCVGFAATPTGRVVFGHLPTPPAGLPSDISYQQLEHPTGEALVNVPFFTLFKGKVQAVGEFADGSRYMFYDGARVTDASAPPNLSGSENPTALLTFQQKVYSAAGPVLYFSAVGDSTDFGAGAGVGDGFIDMSTHANGAENLTGVVRYYEYVAVFASRVIQIWFFDPDPALSRQSQVLNNTGTIAPRSVTQFGDGDVFYLDRDGVRSLRARDSSNSAATTDIGSPIDPLVISALETSAPGVAEKAIGLIEPRDGRFWLSIGDTIYVFSFFSSSKVSAWTQYKPGFVVDHMFVSDDRVWLRSGDKFYVYGGTGDTYQYSENVNAEAWLPYLDANAPTRSKHVNGIDAAVRGEWEVRLGMDLTNLAASDVMARITETTYNLNRIAAQGDGTHLSLRFKCLAPPSPSRPAVLSAAVIHHDLDAEEDS